MRQGLARALPFLRWLGLAALVLLPLPVSAQGAPHRIAAAPLPGIRTPDPRRPVDLGQMPWRALGRVQLELGSRCSGALVGPRTVLTAAHCLVSPRSGRLAQPDSVHVLIGYDRGGFAAHGRVTAYRVAPDFRPELRRPQPGDWALLTLEAALGTPDRVLPVLAGPLPPGTPLMLGGYPQDRPEVLLADAGCRAIGSAAEGALLLHDCASPRGTSGAPVLARMPDGGWAVAGVSSGRMIAEGTIGIAVAAEGFRAALR